jgi:hypothetical protein
MVRHLVSAAHEKHVQPVLTCHNATAHELHCRKQFIKRIGDLNEDRGGGDQRKGTPGADDDWLDDDEED